MIDLSNLKPGDQVLLYFGHRDISPATIAKVHKFHIVLAEHSSIKFRISTGFLVTDDRWNSMCIKPFDAAAWNGYQRVQRERKMRADIAAFDWGSCDIELIRSVHALLPKKPELPQS